MGINDIGNPQAGENCNQSHVARYSSNQRACAEEGTRENKKACLGDCPQGKQYLGQISLSPGFHPENSKCSGDYSVHMPGQTT